MAFALHLTQAVKEHLLAEKQGYSSGRRALPPDHGQSRSSGRFQKVSARQKAMESQQDGCGSDR
jgi:hypothetical protein